MMLKWALSALGAFFLVIISAGGALATTSVQNLSQSGSLLPGQNITVSFQIRSNVTNTNPMRVAVGLSDSVILSNGDDMKRLNWLADSNGIFRSDHYWLNGVSQTVTNLATTDVGNMGSGQADGINVGQATTAWMDVVIPTRIPQEIAGATYYLFVVTREFNIFGGCLNGMATDSIDSLALAIGGSPTYALDLKLCDDSSDADGSGLITTRLNYRVTNYGEAGLPLNFLTWRFYFEDEGQATWESQTFNYPQNFPEDHLRRTVAA